MAAFPSTSSARSRHIYPGSYDLKGLGDAITSATTGKPLAEPEPANPNLFHLHTLTVTSRVLAPREVERYPDGDRPNPDYTYYQSTLERLKAARDACEPLTLLLPTPNVLQIPFEPLRTRQKVARVNRRLTATIGPLCSSRKTPFMELPAILNGQSRCFLQSSSAWDNQNWLHAALALSPAHSPTRSTQYRDDKERIQLRTSLRVVWIPTETDEDDLSVLITIDAYLDMSLVGEPLPAHGNELYRMILSSLIPPVGVDIHANALQAFYSSLRPAPRLSPHLNTDSLRHPRLIAKLLPFQQRTLAVLLQNEKAPLAISDRTRKPSGQWDEIDFDGFGKYVFGRISGELRQISDDRKGKGKASTEAALDMAALPHAFNLDHVRGTMLCEEMGLGKTVEAIALVLLHRHPLSVTFPAAALFQVSDQIDLAAPPPGNDNVEFTTWLSKENDAFKDTTAWSEESQLNVTEVAATLIVTPLPLLKQWIAEMATHAPSLRVAVYPGWNRLIQQVTAKRKATVKARKIREKRKAKRKNTKFRNETRAKYAKGLDGRIPVNVESEDESSEDEDEDDESLDSLLQATQRAWLDYVRRHDVVICTYQTLGDDLKVALPAPKRSRRSTAKYNLEERPRSPLVMLEWWRVIMDEVQLQGGDHSNAANMVSLVPRKNSLAISGTPIRRDIHDLIGSARFLRLSDIGGSSWYRLLQPANCSALHGLFQQLAVRTTKAEVSHEFELPSQSRFIIPIELSAIELHYYEDTLERQRERFRDSAMSDPIAFRSALRHLRQICTHIQVGALNGQQPMERRDRIQLGRQLLTMEEALKKMREEHDAAHVDMVKRQLRYMLRKGQLIVLDDDDDLRNLKAIALYEKVREHAQTILAPARTRLHTLTAGREESIDDELAKDAPQSERERVKNIMSTMSLIRETLLLVHEAWFLQGDAHHVLKEENAEVEAYNTAQTVRNEILARPLKHANKAIETMNTNVERHRVLNAVDELLMHDTNLEGALYTADAIEQANSLLAILNDNATLVFSWRNNIVKLLGKPIEAEDQVVNDDQGQDVVDPEAEYYAEALKVQGEIDAYCTAYAAALADRKEMLMEERTLLEETESRVTKKRTTRRAMEAAADAIVEPTDDQKDLLDRLMQERQAFRDRREEDGCTRSLKAVLIDISNVAHINVRQEEQVIAQQLARIIRTFINGQSSYIDKLSKELDTFRATFNMRVKYYAALQEISDSVRVPEFHSLWKDIAAMDTEIGKCERFLANSVRKGRYLNSLDEDSTRDMRDDCPICFGTSDDEYGVLLDCGHSMCESCFKAYRVAAFIGNRCATCKARIPDRQFKRYRLRPATDTKEGVIESAQGSALSKEAPTVATSAEEVHGQTAVEDEGLIVEDDTEDANNKLLADWRRLRLLDDDRLRSIQELDVMGQYGSKITFLVKHLNWYRLTQPTVRHVVFSNWGDSLRIVERALSANHIKYVSFDANSKSNDVVEKFKADPTIPVFLLHAERESAGLTLTSCGVVHLLEPVLQHSFELQAIGRVDRLGQRQETTVYCYATLDTVETRILSQAVRNGTSIYLADHTEGERAIEAMPNIASSARGGGDLATTGGDATGTAQLLSLIM